LKALLATAVTLSIAASSVSAADLTTRPYTKAPVMADAIYNWTGFYVGGHAGYSWSRGESSGIDLGGFTTPPPPVNHPAGGLGGFQFGYNYQVTPNWVVGLQGDFSGLSASESTAYTGSLLGLPLTGQNSARIEWLSSVTGRLGYAVNNVLFYGKGGAAWVRDHFHNATSTDLGGVFVLTDFSGTTTRTGWTVGGGVEYGWTRNWTVGFEYDYYDFGTLSPSLTGATGLIVGPGMLAPGTTPASFQYRQTLSVAKASLNYRF
jgi:outer membrane immunogenic protein